MTRLPIPLAGDGVVTHNPVSRSLLVKAKAGDRVWPLWRRGHQALLSDSGSFYGPPSVYACGAGRYQVARGEPVRDGWLRFAFRHDEAAYKELAAAADRSTSRLA